MHNSDWIGLIKLIPPEQHNKLCVTTRTGLELAIEMILRTEPEFLVFRGRVMGQTEEGRAFFLPYSEITVINLNRVVAEGEIDAMFDDGPVSERIETGASDYGDESAITPPPPVAAHATVAGKGSGLVPKVPLKAPTPSPLPKVPAGPAESPAAKGSILERLRAQRKNAPGK